MKKKNLKSKFKIYTTLILPHGHCTDRSELKCMMYLPFVLVHSAYKVLKELPIVSPTHQINKNTYLNLLPAGFLNEFLYTLHNKLRDIKKRILI